MGKPYWTQHEKEYFLKKVLPHSCFAKGYFEEGTGDSLEDLAKEMQEYLDQRGFSKRTYTSDNLYQHWYQKVRPLNEQIKSLRPSELSQDSSSTIRSRNITNKSLRSPEEPGASSSASPKMTSNPTMAAAAENTTEKGKGKAKSDPVDDHELGVTVRNSGDENGDEGITDSADARSGTSNGLDVLAELAVASPKLSTGPVTSDSETASTPTPAQRVRSRFGQGMSTTDLETKLPSASVTRSAAKQSEGVIGNSRPESKKRTLGGEESEARGITISAKKTKIQFKNYRSPSVEEEDAGENYVRKLPDNSQGANSNTSKTSRQASLRDGGMSSSSTRGREPSSRPFGASSAGRQVQLESVRGNGDEAYVSPYAPVPPPAVPTPQLPTLQAMNGHRGRFVPGSLERRFAQQGYPGYPLLEGGRSIGGTPQDHARAVYQTSQTSHQARQAQAQDAQHQGMQANYMGQKQGMRGAATRESPSWGLNPAHADSARTYDRPAQRPQGNGPARGPAQVAGPSQTPRGPVQAVQAVQAHGPQQVNPNQTGQAAAPNQYHQGQQHGSPPLGVVLLPYCPSCNRRF